MEEQTKPHQHDHTALKISMWLSALCLVHCITFPMFVVLLPLFNIMFEIPHWIEWLLLGGTLTIGMYSLWHGYKLHHQNYWPFVWFSIGMLVTTLAHVAHGHDTRPALIIISICGAFMIAYSQWRNLRLTKSMACTTKH